MVRLSFSKATKITDVLTINQRVNNQGTSCKEILIGWVPPSSGWCKLSIDGAARKSTNRASAGSVLRVDTSAWLGSFMCQLGPCFVILAELQGVFHGLCLAQARKDVDVVF